MDHKRAREFQKTSTFALLITPKSLTVGNTTNWKILKETGIPDHLTCLLRNLYAGQEATVRIGHGTTDWFKIGKGCSLFNFFTEYIMQNARLGESKAGIKITKRNIDNLRYADDTMLLAEREEELKSFLMRLKRRVKS